MLSVYAFCLSCFLDTCFACLLTSFVRAVGVHDFRRRIHDNIIITHHRPRAIHGARLRAPFVLMAVARGNAVARRWWLCAWPPRTAMVRRWSGGAVTSSGQRWHAMACAAGRLVHACYARGRVSPGGCHERRPHVSTIPPTTVPPTITTAAPVAALPLQSGSGSQLGSASGS